MTILFLKKTIILIFILVAFIQESLSSMKRSLDQACEDQEMNIQEVKKQRVDDSAIEEEIKQLSDINARINDNSDTLLHLYAKSNPKKIIKLIENNKADKYLLNKENETWLHCLIQGFIEAKVNLGLLKKLINLDIIDSKLLSCKDKNNQNIIEAIFKSDLSEKEKLSLLEIVTENSEQYSTHLNNIKKAFYENDLIRFEIIFFLSNDKERKCKILQNFINIWKDGENLKDKKFNKDKFIKFLSSMNIYYFINIETLQLAIEKSENLATIILQLINGPNTHKEFCQVLQETFDRLKKQSINANDYDQDFIIKEKLFNDYKNIESSAIDCILIESIHAKNEVCVNFLIKNGVNLKFALLDIILDDKLGKNEKFDISYLINLILSTDIPLNFKFSCPIKYLGFNPSCYEKTPLIYAIEKNNFDLVKSLLLKKADPNLTVNAIAQRRKNDEEKCTTIDQAKISLIKPLIPYERYAVPDMQEILLTESPIEIAVACNLTEIVDLLLQYEANPKVLSCKYLDLRKTIDNNNIKLLELLLKVDTSQINTVLNYAIGKQNIEIFNLLMAYGAKANENSLLVALGGNIEILEQVNYLDRNIDKNRIKLLFKEAIRRKSLESTIFLYEKIKPHPDFEQIIENGFTWTTIYDIDNIKKFFMEKLIEELAINPKLRIFETFKTFLGKLIAKDKVLITKLSFATMNIETLIKNFKETKDQLIQIYQNRIIIAIENNDLEALKFYITQVPINFSFVHDINKEIFDDEGKRVKKTIQETPIHYAARLNKTDIVKFLISVIPKLISLKNSEEQTAVNLIVGSGNLESLSEILRNSAEDTLFKVAHDIGIERAIDLLKTKLNSKKDSRNSMSANLK